MRKSHFEIPLLIIIVTIGSWLRLVNLRENPGWYTDEGTHLNIAGHMLDGHVQYMAVGDSTLFFARLPLFEILLAGAMSIFGDDILTLRTLTAALGIITIILLWWMIRRQMSSELALLSAFMLAIYPQAILYSRFGFSYNLLAPLVLLVVMALEIYSREGYGLGLVITTIGIGSVSDLMMLTFLVPAAIVVAKYCWRDLWKLSWALVPIIVYSAAMSLTVRDSFWYDIAYTKSRLEGVFVGDQVWNVIETYTILLSGDFWLLGGLIGLGLLIDTRFGPVPLLALIIPIALVARTVPLYHLSAYYLIPLMPLVALGMAVFVYKRVLFLVNKLFAARYNVSRTERAAQWLVSIGLFAAPFIYTVDLVSWYAQTDWITGIDPFLIESHDAEQAVASLTPKDGVTVLVSPGVAWLLSDSVNAADFSVGPAEVRDDTVYFWNNAQMPLTRFRYDPRYTAAQYAIIDPLWREWGEPSIKGVAEMIEDIESEWRLIGTWGRISVYEREQ